MTIAAIKQWFTKAIPTPTDKNRAVQLGCHFEEVAEMLVSTGDLTHAEELSNLATSYKKELEGVHAGYPDRKELLDALCD